MNSGSPAGGHDGLVMLETAIRAAMTTLGASLLEGLLAADTGYAGPYLDCGAGHRAAFVGYRAKHLDTVLGPVSLDRAYYHCPDCHRGLVPRDDQLEVAGVSLSPGLRAMIDQAGAAVPFAQARSLLAELAGITLSTKRVERAAEADGAAAAAELDARTHAILTGQVTLLAPAEPDQGTLYLAVDGTGVPMTGAETAGRAGKAPDGRARTREAKLAALFTQTKTTSDGHPIRDPDSTSYVATLEAVDHFTDLLDAHARQRGSEHIRQFRSRAFVRTLANNGLAGSMGQVGACGDNAAMESFFALLQKNVLDRKRWTTRDELRIAIVTWIERTYHRRRRQDRLGRLTPIEFELIMSKAADQAA